MDLSVRLLARLARDTVLYGLGAVAQSALLFLLLPVYTRVFPPEGYGAFALLLGFLYAGEMLFRSGLHYAFLTLVPHQTDALGRQRLGRTAFSLLMLQATLLLAALLPFGPELSRWLTGSEAHTGAVRLILAHLFFSTPIAVQSCLLRSAGRPKAVVGLNVGHLAVTFACCLGLVAGLHRGVQGAFEGYLAGSGLFGIATLVSLLRREGFGIDSTMRRELYRLGLSLALAQFLLLLLAYSGRYLLLAFSSLHEVALFDLAYKIGMVLSLLVGPFSVAWTSGLFEVARSDRPREAFASVFKYLMAVLTWAALGLGLFAPEAVRLLGGHRYQEAASLVPLLATGFVLSGACAFLGMGPALAKSSREVLTAAAGAVGTNIALGALLIRPWGLWGASIAALAAVLVQTLLMFRGAQRCYPLDYPWRALSRLGLLYGGSLALGLAAAGTSVAFGFVRLALVLSFPLQLYLASFFEPREMDSLRRLPQELLSRGAKAA